MWNKTQLTTIPEKLILILLLSGMALVSGCGGASSDALQNDEVSQVEEPEDETPADDEDEQEEPDDQGEDEEQPSNEDPELSELDESLQSLIDNFGWDTDPLAGRDLPSIEDSVAQLGKKLFYSKSLGGNFDSACASCHHPTLGGADGLPLAVGVDAVNPDVLGPGRVHADGVPRVPRNSPTNFNLGLWDTGLFFDSRVESLGKEEGANGNLSGIRTPDSNFGVADTNAGQNLAAAQARFPVTSTEEMKSDQFEVGSTNAEIRDHLAARIGDYGEGEGELARNDWLAEFQEAFGTTQSADELVTFENIAHALGEFQRSMVFVDSPWQNYLDGNLTALSDEEKRGAILFFEDVDDGGAGCANCHNGSLFSDGEHHTIAFPQIGPGKGDGNNDDFGRERETGDDDDRYRFRTPSLLNIAQSAPYGHSGAYDTLREVIRHYINPANTVEDYFDRGGWCDQNQFEDINGCETLYPNAEDNSELALAKLRLERDRGQSQFRSPRLNMQEQNDLIAFLEALSDPCVENRACLDDWIADGTNDNPDDQVLIAVDEDGNPL